jgi:hypothetical protein
MSTYEALKYTFTGANITGIPTSAVSSGTFADARISSGSVTQHVTAVTQATGTWTPSPSAGGFTNVDGRYARVGNIVICVASGQWSSQVGNSGTNFFNISGLPITPRSGGSTAVGMGYYFFHRQEGTTGLLNVVPGNSTMNLYNGEAQIGTSSKDTSSEFTRAVLQQDAAGGYRIIDKNMHACSLTNSYWNMQVYYQV